MAKMEMYPSKFVSVPLIQIRSSPHEMVTPSLYSTLNFRCNMKQILQLSLTPPFINHVLYGFIILAIQLKTSL